MARQYLTLARARKLAENIVKNDDSNVDSLIELFVRTAGKADATQKAIRNEVLKAWYNQTEHYRDSFRQYLDQFEEPEDEGKELDAEAIESNAPAS